MFNDEHLAVNWLIHKSVYHPHSSLTLEPPALEGFEHLEHLNFKIKILSAPVLISILLVVLLVVAAVVQ